jgi:protein-disulfide isomerase
MSPSARNVALALVFLAPAGAWTQQEPEQPEKKEAAPPAVAEKPAPPRPTVVPPQPLAATVGDVRISALDLEEKVGGRLMGLRSQEYEVKRQALEEMIGDVLLRKEAESRGVPFEQLVEDEIEAKATPVTDEDVTKTWESAKRRFPGKTQADFDGEIRGRLRTQRLQARRNDVVKELRAKSSVRVILEPPRLPIRTAGGPEKGGKGAPVTIVEYSDFQCPYCGRVTPSLKRVSDRYGDSVRMVFRDFPLPIHQQAPKASEAAACADEQGKFWEMHDRLFANQSRLQVADLKQHAADVGLDAAKFDECLDSGRRAADVKRSAEEARRYGVSSTPSFFINGRLLTGAQPYESFARIIDEELTRAGVPIPPEPPAPAPTPAATPAPKAETQPDDSQ